MGYPAFVQDFQPGVILDDDVFTLYIAGMLGRAGMNSMKKFLDSYGLPHFLRDDFLKSLDRIRNEKVDILIGNHPGDVDTAGKWLPPENK